VPANLAEGHGRSGRDRLHFWRVAYASAKEVDSHSRLLVQVGVVDGAKAKYPIETFDEVRAMTWRLHNPSPVASSLHDCSGSIPRVGNSKIAAGCCGGSRIIQRRSQ
jgi:hypothetical protein